MNVLSLFDGMSCGRIALERLGIKVDNYYASEIDKYAIQVSQANYPDIIQVGDVTELDTSTLPKIDLVMGGSPCQGFSFAGKQLAFDDPRSALFFEFVRCVKELQPKYFLLENVRMKKEYLDVISEYMGVEPICINSALLSAQNRVRFYWTNIPGIEQPKDRGIVLRDILETNENDILNNIQEKSHVIKAQYYKNSKANFEANNGFRATGIPQKPETISNKDNKSYALTASYPSARPRRSKAKHEKTMVKVDDINNLPNNVDYIYDQNDKSYKPETISVDKEKKQPTIKDGSQGDRIYSQDAKGITLNAQSGGTAGSGNMLVETHDKPKQVGTAVDIKGHDQIKRVYSPDGKSPTLTTCGGGHREPKVAVFSEDRINKFKETLKDDPKPSANGIIQLNNPSDSSGRVYSPDGKSPTLMAGNSGGGKEPVKINDNVYWRKLTPVECERLQTVPDNYTNHVSNTQRYKMLGNGWTIEVIIHILKNMELPK